MLIRECSPSAAGKWSTGASGVLGALVAKAAKEEAARLYMHHLKITIISSIHLPCQIMWLPSFCNLLV